MIGIIGGSGLYELPGIQDLQAVTVETPFGATSDQIMTGKLGSANVAFLARHRRGHGLIPSEIPYRANIWALKSLGVRYLISVSAVGSLRGNLRPQHMVLPDQYIDLTKSRSSTFFGDGAVAHVSMADPVCTNLSSVIEQAVDQFNGESAADSVTLHRGGTYVSMEGPQLSSRAESHWYRSMGADVIGMTNMPEAKLAMEAQMAYASLAMVTDFDCWHPGEDAVTTTSALENLLANAERAKSILALAVQSIEAQKPSSASHQSLAHALVGDPVNLPEHLQVLTR